MSVTLLFIDGKYYVSYSIQLLFDGFEITIQIQRTNHNSILAKSRVKIRSNLLLGSSIKQHPADIAGIVLIKGKKKELLAIEQKEEITDGESNKNA